jgi:predicted TIM-barrel fold metal-dependent hydrolase
MLPSGRVDELLPYLSPYWARYVRSSGFQGPPNHLPWYRAPARLRAEWQIEGAVQGSDPKKAAADLFDGLGVSAALLCNPSMHVSSMRGAFELAAAIGTAYNDYSIEHWLDKDPRFFGSVYVVAHHPEEAAREIDRVGAHPQIVQVFLPVVSDRQYGQRQYWPIYEAAVRNDLVIGMHHGQDVTGVLGYPNYFSEWHTTVLPAAMAAQIASMLFNGVFDRFPTLKVCCLEAGFSWMPSLMSRADHQRLQFREEIPWVKRKPSEHLRQHVRLATQPMEHFSGSEFMKLVDLFGSEDMLMFSSDYPHYDSDSPARALPAGLPQGLRQKIMRDNALATYPKLKGV